MSFHNHSLRRIVWWMRVLGVLGFIDAAYLTIEHFTGQGLVCVITSGCDVVTTSSYATIGPVPVALLGVLYYLSIIILSTIFLEGKRRSYVVTLFWFSVFGVVFSLWFLYVQAFVLYSYCIYCLVSLTLSVLLFTLGSMAIRASTDAGVSENGFDASSYPS